RSVCWAALSPARWTDYRPLRRPFVAHTPGMKGLPSARPQNRPEPLRWPCPDEKHPGVSTLYLDHPTWYAAAKALGHDGKRFLTPSGKVELFTQALEQKLSAAGHGALPVFYTHPEVTGRHPTLRYSADLVANPVNPH